MLGLDQRRAQIPAAKLPRLRFLHGIDARSDEDHLVRCVVVNQELSRPEHSARHVVCHASSGKRGALAPGMRHGSATLPQRQKLVAVARGADWYDSSPMDAYGSREVARMLGLSVGQVRAFVRAGFLEPSRGPRGELRFSFHDLVLLRTAQGLVQARIPPRRVKQALRQLRERLPEGSALRGLRIAAEGDRIVVGDGAARWQADSGQVMFDFEIADLERKVAPLSHAPRLRGPSAEALYEQGCELEEDDPDAACAAYERAIALDPRHADAHVNLGRLLHEAGDAEAAAEHYRIAAEARPDDATAAFNLGVALEDLERPAEAVAAYERAVAADPACADAHYNLAGLHERTGSPAAALRHLRTYRKLLRDGRAS